MSILSEYDENLDKMSYDEAFLDITDYCSEKRLLSDDDLTKFCKEIQARIYNSTFLTASIGVSFNKFLAKMASEENKPNGVCILIERDVKDYLKNKAIRKVPGVGPRYEFRLNLLGIHKIKHIEEKAADLYFIANDDYKEFDYLMEKVVGIGENEHKEKKEFNESISKSQTFKRNKNFPFCSAILKFLVEEVFAELDHERICCKCVGVEVRTEEEQNLSKRYSNKNIVIGINEALLKSKEMLKNLMETCNKRIRLVRFCVRSFIKNTELGLAGRGYKDLFKMVKSMKPATLEEINEKKKEKKTSKMKSEKKKESILSWFSRKDEVSSEKNRNLSN